MRSRILRIVMLACAALSARAQNPQQVFEQANQLYQEGKFAEAREAYEALVKNGYGGGTLYYNLGNAYYKTGDIGRAILSYERALKVMSGDDDLRHNLQLANSVLIDKIEPTPRLFIWDYWDGVKQFFSLRGLTWLAYALYVLTLVAFAAFVLVRTYRLRKISLIGGLVSGCIMLFLIVVLVARLTDLGKRDRAIVTAQIATVKNSPDAKSSDAFVLHAGAKVQITDQLSEWVQVRLADGKVGWMERSAAEVI
jgi:tetratricopeptide (TPR) repeat protein